MGLTKDRKAAHDRSLQPPRLHLPARYAASDDRQLGIESGMRKPDVLRELTEQHHDLIDLMVYGPEADMLGYRAHWPLTLIEAADCLGMRRRNARQISTELLFVAEFNKQLASLRKMEGPRNVATMKQIRDEPGANEAADRNVRLKASDMLEGKDKGFNVNVAVNTQNNIVAPGYVIRLRPAEPQPQILDHVSPLEDDQAQ